MREIKFRAWDKVNNRIIDHKYIGVLLKNVGRNNQFHYMQYTGLKDKNGKEIYEGDIVEKELFGGLKTKVQVEWIEDFSCFGYKPCTPYDYGNLTKEFVEDFSIIGDIHTTPELLEKP